MRDNEEKTSDFFVFQGRPAFASRSRQRVRADADVILVLRLTRRFFTRVYISGVISVLMGGQSR